MLFIKRLKVQRYKAAITYHTRLDRNAMWAECRIISGKQHNVGSKM